VLGQEARSSAGSAIKILIEWSHVRILVQRRHQRELSTGQTERAQCVVDTPPRALARRAVREGRGKNRGPGSLFRKMCLELLPYINVITLCYIPIS
jgi:hypothetical protein